MSKVLIIEDEQSIAALEKDYLELYDFEVSIENDGQKGLDRALLENYDIVIVDLMLPTVDGFEICKRIREVKDIPILVVSAKKEDIDKIRGLELGADDYITKPFNPAEVIARVRSCLRRYTVLGGNTNSSNVLKNGGIEINDDSKTVTVDGNVILLTPVEYDILLLLMKNTGKVCPNTTNIPAN